MDPTNPRWLTSEQRRARSALFWKVFVGALAASAATTVAVATCHDRGGSAQHVVGEPSRVTTTGAFAEPVAATAATPPPAMPFPMPAPNAGVAEAPPAGTTNVTSTVIINGVPQEGVTSTVLQASAAVRPPPAQAVVTQPATTAAGAAPAAAGDVPGQQQQPQTGGAFPILIPFPAPTASNAPTARAGSTSTGTPGSSGAPVPSSPVQGGPPVQGGAPAPTSPVQGGPPGQGGPPVFGGTPPNAR